MRACVSAIGRAIVLCFLLSFSLSLSLSLSLRSKGTTNFLSPFSFCHRVGILAALAVAATCGFWLWKRRRSTLSEDYVSSERTSTGPWYPPPRYSRCSSFVQALPPPYNEVSSRSFAPLIRLSAYYPYTFSFYRVASLHAHATESILLPIYPGDGETGPVSTGDRLRREFGQRNFRFRDALLQIAVSYQHLGFVEFQFHVQRRQWSQHRCSTTVFLRRQRRWAIGRGQLRQKTDDG